MSVSDRPRAPSAPAELRRIPLLELMPADVRRLVVASFTPVKFGFGEVIVAEGDEADALFVIESGWARVVKAGDHGEEVPLNVPHYVWGHAAQVEIKGRSGMETVYPVIARS